MITFLIKLNLQIWAHATKANIFQNPYICIHSSPFLKTKLVSFHKYFIIGMHYFFVFLESSLRMLITMVDICVIRMAYSLTDCYKIGPNP